MREGEMHWENNLKTLAERKSEGLGAKLQEEFCCPHPSDCWKT